MVALVRLTAKVSVRLVVIGGACFRAGIVVRFPRRRLAQTVVRRIAVIGSLVLRSVRNACAVAARVVGIGDYPAVLRSVSKYTEKARVKPPTICPITSFSHQGNIISS